MRGLASDPLNSEVVYAGTQGSGVLRSDDPGKTWRPAGLEGHTGKSLAVSRSEPGAVYAGTKPALVFVSHDGGARWTELDAFRRKAPGHVYVGLSNGKVWRSVDYGENWRQLPFGLKAIVGSSCCECCTRDRSV